MKKKYYFHVTFVLKSVTSLVFLFSACIFHLNAQVARLYTSEDGLKTNYCNSVDIDSRGFVWISGLNTLGLFDGTHFQYLPTTTTADGHPLFQYAYGVKEVDVENYAVATSQGLYIFDARNMDFHRIYLHEREDSVYGYAINAITDYPQKDCQLITTDGFGTYVVNTRTMEVNRESSDRISREIDNAFVSRPIVDGKMRLWFTTTKKALMCIDLNEIKNYTFDITPAAQAILDISTVTDLLETEKGILIGTNNGLLMYNEEENMVHEFPIISGHLCVRSLLRTTDGRILIGTDGRGIWEYANGENGMTLVPLYGTADGFDISYGKVADMAEDSKGNIVAFFLQKGLVIIPPQNNCFHYHPISPNANGQNATCVTSMIIDGQKNYWVATDGCGVFTTQGMRLASAYPVNEGLRSLLVQDIEIDKHGTIWAGTFGGGVQYFENGRWTGEWLSDLSQELVMAMFYDKETDQILVGTNGNGVYCIDIAKKTVKKIRFPFPYNSWVCSLLLDSQHTLWIATSSGLFYYSEKDEIHEEIQFGDYRICNASAIQEDGDNILIACDEGLIIYNKKTKKKEFLTSEQNQSIEYIRSVMTTEHHIWLATRSNIVSIDKENREIRTFSSFNGYKVGEFHRNSAIKPGEGYILFGGDNGIICFTPELIISRQTEIGHLYFTSFSTPLNTEKMDAHISYAKEIKLGSDNSSFSIGFSAVELSDPERIHYDYILEGHESMWHKEAPSPHASYSSLPPGNYTFRVRAHFEDNPTRYTENTIEIHVAAPWYASVWAFIVYGLIIITILFFIHQHIQIRKKEKEQLRQSAEKNRMKEAKLRLFTSITHELRSPLTMIESPLKQLIEEDKNADRRSLYTVMLRNCNRLLDIVKQITDIRKIDSGQFKLRFEEQNYVPYSNHVFEQFKGIATVKGISFIVEHSEEEVPLMIDTVHFEKIITNILSNAFKFTPQEGKVIARSGIVGDKAELRFYNSGSHINEKDLGHLWERFYQGDAGSDSSGSGIGLNLVYELVKMHHGSINVKNIEPDGVEFTLCFPLLSVQSQTEEDTGTGEITVMLVDDDTEMSAYLTSQLKKDYKIMTAFSGNSAWKKILLQRPDVVVTDYRMPDGNGMELCQLIKNHPETDSMPVIMLTGEGDETLQLHSLNIQVDHYLEKPVNVTILRSAISQVLRTREKMLNKIYRTEMGKETPKPVIESAEEKLYNRINETLISHIEDSGFSVLQLSEEVGISRVHLNRKMKIRYGMSPTAFIKTFRLKQAAYLLVNNNVSISEVVYKVGFSSHSYFTTAFREYFGMSPKEFVAYYSDEENRIQLQKLLE